jgi:hypothetical protein
MMFVALLLELRNIREPQKWGLPILLSGARYRLRSIIAAMPAAPMANGKASDDPTLETAPEAS